MHANDLAITNDRKKRFCSEVNETNHSRILQFGGIQLWNQSDYTNHLIYTISVSLKDWEIINTVNVSQTKSLWD